MAPMLHRLLAALILLPLDNPAAWTIFNELPNAPSRKSWQMPDLSPSFDLPSWPTTLLSAEANEMVNAHNAVTRHLDSECRPAVERGLALLSSLPLSQSEHSMACETAAMMSEALSGANNDQHGLGAAEGIIAALFARAVQESQISIETVDNFFGPAVAELTQNGAEIVQLTEDSRALLWNGHHGERVRISDSQAENLRNLLITMSSDWRVVTLVLVHNLRRLSLMVNPVPYDHDLDYAETAPTASQPRDRETFIAAREALDVYAPLAHRLGMYKIKLELENLGFRHLYPCQHRLVSKSLARREKKHQVVLSEQLLVLKRLLKEDTEFMSSIDSVVVEGRQKSPYSTWKKLHKISRGRPSGWAKDQHTNAVDRVLDAIALRIILKPKPSIQDEGVGLCYRTLGQVHDNWAHMDFRVKDFIRNPKENGYQALHTTCTMRYHGREWPFEVQVRTQDMHRIAEWGKAAHFRYKEGRDDDMPMQWLQDGDSLGSTYNYVDSLKTQKSVEMEEADDEDEIIMSGKEYTHWLRHKLRNNRVFVFGSDGDIWDLERGFTVRDAVGYGNHPSQGPVCDVSRVRVNGRFQRADYMLQNGDVVGSSEAQKA